MGALGHQGLVIIECLLFHDSFLFIDILYPYIYDYSECQGVGFMVFLCARYFSGTFYGQ